MSEEISENEYGNLTTYEGVYCAKCDDLLGYSDKEAFDLTYLCEKCMDKLETEQQKVGSDKQSLREVKQ